MCLDFLSLPLLDQIWSRSSRQKNQNLAMIGLHLFPSLLQMRCTAWNLILETSMPRSLLMRLYTTSLQSSSSLSVMFLNLKLSLLVYCLRFVFRSASSFRLCFKTLIPSFNSTVLEICSSDSVLNCSFRVSTSPWVKVRLCLISFIVEFTAFISDLNSCRSLSKLA